MLAVGCLAVNYSLPLFCAAVWIGMANLAKSFEHDSWQFALSAVPHALFACIAPWAVAYLFGLQIDWSRASMDASHHLVNGTVSFPAQAVAIAQNPGNAKVVELAVSLLCNQ